MKAGSLWVALGALSATAALAQEPGAGRALRHDPFSRIAIQRIVQQPPADDRRRSDPARPSEVSQAAAAAAPAAAAAVEPLPVLRALLRSGSRPMVNVDGTLLEIGDEIHGMRLVGIGEYSAVFMKKRKLVELALGRAPIQ